MDRSDYHSKIILPFLRDYYRWPDDISDRYARGMNEAHQMVCTSDTSVLMDMRAAMPNVFDMAITYSYVNPYVAEFTESWVDNLGFDAAQTIVWKNARQAWLNDLLKYAEARMNKDPKYRTYDSEVFAEFFEEFKNTPAKHRNEFIVVSDGVLIAEANEAQSVLEATLSEDTAFPTVSTGSSVAQKEHTP